MILSVNRADSIEIDRNLLFEALRYGKVGFTDDGF